MLAFINNLFQGWDLIIILLIGLLVFGKRLPEVGRGLGKGIVEFKKGLKGIEDDIEDQSSKPARPRGGEVRPTQESLPDATADHIRPPLTPAGEDVRVSRADKIEEPHAPQPHEPAKP